MIKHPKFFGFKLGLTFCFAPERVKNINYLKPSKQEDVVYVALLAGAHRPLKEDDVFKVGQTGGRLKDRWAGTLGIFNPRRKKTLRNNEKEDRRKGFKKGKGKKVSVWVKKAEKIKIKYGGLQLNISRRWSEEEFFMKYYLPSEVQRRKSKETD